MPPYIPVRDIKSLGGYVIDTEDIQNPFDPRYSTVKALVTVPNNNAFNFLGVTVGGVGTFTAGIATPADTDYLSRRSRIAAVSAAGADSSAGVTAIGAFGNPYLMNRVGYFVSMMCGHIAVSSTYRWFLGLHTTNIAAMPDPSTLLNTIGIGADSSDGNVQFISNDGAGLATKIDLGPSFPARIVNSTYYLSLYCPPEEDIQCIVKRLDTGVVSKIVSINNKPALGTLLLGIQMASNGAAGGAITLAMMDMWMSYPI